MRFTNFSELDDHAKFGAIVTNHLSKSFSKLTAQVDCEPCIDQALVDLAYETYSLSLSQFAKLLASKNPDQYKRSGALLHALYKSRPIVDVLVNGNTREELESGFLHGVSFADAKHRIEFIDEYSSVANEILSFDLAYSCCQVYEPQLKAYDIDFMDNMIYYMRENSSLSVASFAMIFKALMA